jgi:hypothetical protein
MHLSNMRRGEFIAIAGGIVLAVALFLDWYYAAGPNGKIPADTGHSGSFSGWDVHTTLRYLLLAAAAAPLILGYIIARDYALSWPRGEMTAVTAIAAFGLITYNGFVNKPGAPPAEISLQIGFFAAIAGTLLMLYGAAARSGETERKRKPPGMI